MKERSYYGLIGNGETAALVGPDLAIRWFCIPRFDGTPVFAGALDPRRGGGLTVALLKEDGCEHFLEPLRQQYPDDAAVLVSTVSAGPWVVEACDFMPWATPCLVRELRITNRADVEQRCLVRLNLAAVASEALPVRVSAGRADAFIHAAGGVLALDSVGVTDLGRVCPGASVSLRLHLGYGVLESDSLRALEAARRATADEVAAFWRDWLGGARQPAGLPAERAAGYRRSLMVLKLLSYPRSGALLAAPTASFPAVPGGGDNWDYRYLWLRDGYYTAMTLDAVGLHAEARAFYDLAFSLQGPDGHWQQPLYTVDGANPTEFVAPDLAGPGGEVPIRFGNAASGQLQLDNEGNIIHGLWFHYRTSGDRSVLERNWDGVRRACTWTAGNWHRRENGIWELRDYTAHWVHGKAMCYAGLIAGARIADELGHGDEARTWRSLAEAIRTDVVERGWNARRKAYLRHYGEGTPEPCVDISVLALVFYGLLPPDDLRIVATVALIERDQADGGLGKLGGICRYDYAAVPFYLPTLWLARYYLMAGRKRDCTRLLEACLRCATSLGLMAEHFDGQTGEQWGNFPQAFSHEEVARLELELSQGWSFHQWDQAQTDR